MNEHGDSIRRLGALELLSDSELEAIIAYHHKEYLRAMSIMDERNAER